MIPDTWAKFKERQRWSASTNAWEYVQSWKGTAGPGRATYIQWLANFFGYTSLEFSIDKEHSDGDGIVTVDIGFASNAQGETLPPSHPDYGLIERIWTKHTQKAQESIMSHWRLLCLLTEAEGTSARKRQEDMLTSLQLSAQRYRQDYKTWIKLKFDFMRDNPGMEYTIAAPSTQLYITAVVGTTAFTTDQYLAIEWLFSEIAANANASWNRNVPVLRKTEVVLSVTNLRPSHENVDRIFTYLALLRTEGSIPLDGIIYASGLSDWYWLKQSPEVERTSNGWFRITQEYEGINYIAPNTLMRYGTIIE